MKGVIFCSLVITRFVELIQQHLVFFEAIYTSFRRQNPFMASNQSPEGAKYTSDGHSPSLNNCAFYQKINCETDARVRR
jgi:hypothetical protein